MQMVELEKMNDPEEIAVLSHAFNNMTRDLQSQQKALTLASDEANFITGACLEVDGGRCV